MNKTLRNLALVALAAAPFSAFAEIAGSGTAEDPYQIATAEDLTKACTKVVASGTIYFVQVADIDMEGVKDYFAVNGTYGDYTSAIVYDGCNHVIANFAPDYVADGGAQGYYDGSIFGVLIGKVKNLGVVNANVDMKGNNKTAGILGAYFGHGSVANSEEYATSVLENVYVTGKIAAGNYNTGGMFGTTGSAVEMTNCFANVEYTGTGGNMGGVIGRVNHEMTVTNCYVAGTVNEAAGLVAGGGSGTLTVDGLVAFNTGSEKVCGVAGNVDDIIVANTSNTLSEGLDEVKGWAAFSETEVIDGYPALNYVLSGEGTEDNPYIIASAKDLCNAYRFVDTHSATTYYFVQTADIDMDEVKDPEDGVVDYHAILGNDGTYNASVNYDGQNHLIKNFCPAVTPWAETDGTQYYYCASLFGAGGGTVKNLGVVDADCVTDHGAGILFAYAGTGASSDLTIENVFVTGSLVGEGGYTGAFGGTTGNSVVVKNSFANVDVEGASNTAGLIGRARNDVELNGVYVAGTVTGASALVIASDKTPNDVTIVATDVIAFNTGAAVACNIEIEGEIEVADADNEAELIKGIVEDWDAYTDQLYKGYPMLDGFDVETAGFVDVVVGGVEANGPAVYYNLQGVRVANPENGIYIVRRGNKVTKEFVK